MCACMYESCSPMLLQWPYINLGNGPKSEVAIRHFKMNRQEKRIQTPVYFRGLTFMGLFSVDCDSTQRGISVSKIVNVKNG